MDIRLYQVAFAPKAGEEKPEVRVYVADTLKRVLDYVRGLDGQIIGINEMGPAILCGSFVDFE